MFFKVRSLILFMIISNSFIFKYNEAVPAVILSDDKNEISKDTIIEGLDGDEINAPKVKELAYGYYFRPLPPGVPAPVVPPVYPPGVPPPPPSTYSSNNQLCSNNMPPCPSGMLCLYGKCVCAQGFKYSTWYKTCIDCPYDWTMNKGGCFMVKAQVNASWNSATTDCYKFNADLIQVASEEHFKFWQDLSSTLPLTSGQYYVGLRQQGITTNFTWTYLNGRTSPADGPIWQLTNLLNSFSISTLSGLTKQNIQRCVFVDQNFQYGIVDCDAFSITSYICQRRNSDFSVYNRGIRYQNPYQVYPTTFSYNGPPNPTTCGNSAMCQYSAGKQCLNGKCQCAIGFTWSTARATCIPCAAPWQYIEGKCYFNSFLNTLPGSSPIGYQLGRMKRQTQTQPKNGPSITFSSWHEAQKYCLANNSLLVNIDGAPGYPDLMGRVLRSFDTDETYWIGGYRFNNNSGYNFFDQSVLNISKPWYALSLTTVLNNNLTNPLQTLFLNSWDVPTFLNKTGCYGAVSAGLSILIFPQNCTNTSLPFICERVDSVASSTQVSALNALATTLRSILF